MASFNVSLDDSSPLLSYSPAGAWIDTPDNDPVVSQYQGHSLHVSSNKDATATLKFNGTGVWFYGGRRQNYGGYSLTVDGKVLSSGTSAASNSTAQQVLVGASSLGMGEHTAVLTNTGTGAVDVDSVLFETQVGTTSGTVSYAIIEDGSSNVTYSGSDWLYSSNAMFSANGTHYTQANGATTSITFFGDAVAVYGGASFDHDNYTVALDGMLQQFNGGSNGQVRMYHPQTMLYFAANVGNGSHTVTFTNNAIANASFFDIDQIGVYISPSYSNDTSAAASAQASGGTYPNIYPSGNVHVNQVDASNASAAGASSTSPTKKGMPKGVLASLIIFSVLAFFLIITLVIFLVRRRRQKHKKSMKKRELPSPVLPIQDDPEKGLPFDGSGPAFPSRKLDDVRVPSDNLNTFSTQSGLNRTLSTRTSATKWSQSSDDSTETLKAYPLPKINMPEASPAPQLPPVAPLSVAQPTPTPHSPAHPPMPTPPVIPMPQHMQGRERSGSMSSVSSASSPQSSNYSDDEEDFASYYRDSILGPAQYEYRHEVGAPTRPPRPPGLDLNGTEFRSVQL